MCIIVTREAGVEIDYDTRFKNMVINNPHGFGLAIPEGNGRLVMVKQLASDDGKMDPEALYRMVQEELIEEKVMFHLRYTTAGETSFRNLHPFPVLEREADGVDLRMAHNGTIHKWKHGHTEQTYKWESDTRHFVRGFVRPLFKRLIRGSDTEDLLTDPFVNALLDEQIPSASVLSFIDGYGNTLEVNPTGNGGMYEDEKKIWFSNKYSFNATHRTPSTLTGSRVWRNNGWHTLDDWEDEYRGNANTGAGSKTKAVNSVLASDTQTEFFSDKYSEVITNPNEIFLLKDATLELIQDEDPEDMLLLVKELIFRCSGMYQALAKKEKDVDLVKEIAALKAQCQTQKATIEAFQNKGKETTNGKAA